MTTGLIAALFAFAILALPGRPLATGVADPSVVVAPHGGWRDRARAAVRLGECALALSILDAAAAAGDAGPHYERGVLFDRGQCVQSDVAQAHRNYWRAAIGGDLHGMQALAGMYASGRGVPADRARSNYWFRAMVFRSWARRRTKCSLP